MANNSHAFDLLIVGGGMIGATLALTVNRRLPSLRVALIEPFPPATAHQETTFDKRAIALSAGSCAFLDELGLWRGLRQYAEPIKHIHVSERGALPSTRLHHDHFGLDALGQVIPVQPLGQELWQAMNAADNISLFAPAKISELSRDADTVTLMLESGEQLTGRLLVGADGTNSEVRRRLGIEVQSQDYQQHALIATLQSELPHRGWAYERLTESGPLALLPLPENRLSLVWSLPPAQAEQLLDCPDAEFLKALQHAFGWRQGQLVRVGGRHVYPLSMRKVSAITSHRAALIGNAAHALHPVAGQGYNLGLRDVMMLVSQLEQVTQQGADIGARQSLAAYREQRTQDIALTLGWSDALVKVFAQEQAWVRLLRRSGIGALNWLPGVRASIGWQGMGLGLFSHE